jgi:serine protease AprX
MKNIVRFFSLLVVITMLLGLNAPLFALPAAKVSNAHPALLQIADQDPEQTVAIIVQKANHGANLAAQIEKMGGEITQELTIINAFAAIMPARAAVELASSPHVRWVSLDAPMVEASCVDCVTSASLVNNYVKSVQADKVWNLATPLQGQGIGVAVLDSGVNYQTDLYTLMGRNRVVASVSTQDGYNQSTFDGYGHGSNVAGIVGGNGRTSGGKYIGIAPLVDIINVKVCDDLKLGECTAQAVVSGLQWVLEHKNTYNIRVVNLSLNTTVAESYHTSPIDAAIEVLWFNGIVVVVSAGNKGTAGLYPPANDPFAIVVGAADDKNTVSISDDKIAGFSSYGTTVDGFAKPDLVAPGINIISLMGNSGMGLPAEHPQNVIDGSYFKMSGTSVAAPIVSGAVALLLQDEPNLTPDQVKYRLTATANKNWGGYSQSKAGAGYLDVFAAINGTTTQSANTGTLPSQMLSTGSEPISWGSVGWNSVGWNSVGWNSVGWNSVGWNSVGWNSDYWEDQQ